MANNYLQFSEVINDLSDEEIKFFHERFSWEPPDELPEEFEWPGWFDADCGSVNYDYDLDRKSRSIHFYAEEFGNVDTLCVLVKEFILKFRPDFIFSITYAETCSKMRVGEFGGGALVVSKHGIDWINTYVWVEKKIEEIRQRQ
jgi:hypothetical protein